MVAEATDSAKAGAPENEIEVTPEMIAAGERALSENYQSLCAGDEYPEIARTVFEAMMAVRLQCAAKVDRGPA